MNNNLIPFTKVWNDAQGNYGEKEYWFNPAIEIKGLEPCFIKKNGQPIQCTKIFYQSNFITLIGTPEQFFLTCRQANVAVCLLQDLYRQGITIKQFLQENENINGISLSH